MKSLLLSLSVVCFASFSYACGCSKGSCSNHGGAKACASKSCDSKTKTCACGDKEHKAEGKDKKKKS